jgi:hypothetical protein
MVMMMRALRSVAVTAVSVLRMIRRRVNPGSYSDKDINGFPFV